jgi:hypothetical protein
MNKPALPNNSKARQEWELRLMRQAYRNELELGNEKHAQDFLDAILLVEKEQVDQRGRMHNMRQHRRFERAQRGE